MRLRLAISTCPNDTFMFDALLHSRVPSEGLEFDTWMGDILHLNQMAERGDADVVKMSYFTWARVRDRYALLRSGSAMGRGCGPLLVAKQGITPEELAQKNALIAVPGFNTTANALLTFFEPRLTCREEMIFHEIMPAVVSGQADAGVIIHENRFTYQQHGLVCVQDLGAFWEQKTGLPIPLGCIAVKKSLGEDVIHRMERALRASVEYAFLHPEASRKFVQEHAQEMDSAVCEAHIHLYVNEFSVDLGEMGERAVQKFLSVVG